jgi:hypothetical protein
MPPFAAFELLALLVEGDEAMQQAAVLSGVVEVLAKRVDPQCEPSAATRTGALTALAAIAAKSASARKAVARVVQWAHVMHGLNDPAATVRRAATK